MRALMVVAGTLVIAVVVTVFWLLIERALHHRYERHRRQQSEDQTDATSALLMALDDMEEALRIDAAGTPFLDHSTREWMEDNVGVLRQRYYKEQPDE